MAELDRAAIQNVFEVLVNMAPAELESWLDTDESRKVGWKGSDGKRSESVGHASGRRIVGILRMNKAVLSDDDYRHMRKVIGYIRRHSAQQPANIYTSRWRYSLMNWGHDPTKD